MRTFAGAPTLWVGQRSARRRRSCAHHNSSLDLFIANASYNNAMRRSGARRRAAAAARTAAASQLAAAAAISPYLWCTYTTVCAVLWGCARRYAASGAGATPLRGTCRTVTHTGPVPSLLLAGCMPTVPQWAHRLGYVAVMAWWGVYVYHFYVQTHGEAFLPILARLPNGTANMAVARLGLLGGVALFCVASLSDPGVVTQPPHCAPGSSDGGSAGGVHRCRRCGHHVVWFDHHCVWMGCCVGLRNMRLFLAFTAFHLALTVYSSVLILCFMAVLHKGLTSRDEPIVRWTVELLSDGQVAPWWAAPFLCPHAVLREVLHGAAALAGTPLSSHSLEAARALLPAHGGGAAAAGSATHPTSLQVVLLVLDSQSLALWTLCLSVGVALWLGHALGRTLYAVQQGTTYYQQWRAARTARADRHRRRRLDIGFDSAGCYPGPPLSRSPPRGHVREATCADSQSCLLTWRDLGQRWANFCAMCACKLPPAPAGREAIAEAQRALATCDKVH